MTSGTGSQGGGNARPTMADIARELGVAKITVSRALSSHSTVKESTRKLIRETAERMGYRLNISARNLRQKRTRTIAVVIEMAPSHDRLMSEPYPLSLLGGIMQELTAAGQNMVLTTIDLFTEHPPSTDGVILLGQGVHDDAAAAIEATGLPYVSGAPRTAPTSASSSAATTGRAGASPPTICSAAGGANCSSSARRSMARSRIASAASRPG